MPDLNGVEVQDDFEDVALVDDNQRRSSGSLQRTSSTIGAWFNGLLKSRDKTSSTQGFQPLHEFDVSSPSHRGRGAT
jgi:hypothetical protein